MTAPAPLGEIEHLSKTFGGKAALSDVSLQVPAGQLSGLLGPNGAGKTTLFRLLMGILKATSGSLRIDGRDAFEDRVEALIEHLALADAMGQFADDFSRGMKKKLGLVMAMLRSPKLLLLDDPTNGMDVESTHLFYELMREEALRGTTVFFSTHLMDQVSRLCQDVAIIHRGRVSVTGSISIRSGRERS